MDQHKQWNNELMAVHIFKIIMFAIQVSRKIVLVIAGNLEIIMYGNLLAVKCASDTRKVALVLVLVLALGL